MKRKILFISLGFLIIVLLGISIFYIKYGENNSKKEEQNKINNSSNQQNEDALNEWISFEFDYYEEDGETHTYQMNSVKLSFKDDMVEVCDFAFDKCEKVKYTFEDNKLDIFIGEEKIFFGYFIVDYKENLLLLELKQDDVTKIIYRFKKYEEKEEE